MAKCGCGYHKMFACMDCGSCTNCMDEYYMVHDSVWLEANPKDHGMLCIGCLESRRGKLLTARDFTAAPINGIASAVGSTRLRNRLTA